MKNLKLTEQQLDKIITKTVKKHLLEQDKGTLTLLKEYIDSTIMKLEKAKRLLEHPDAHFLVEENPDVFDEGVAIIYHADGLLKHLKAELGSYTPPIEPGYSEKEFSQPVRAKKKSFSLNEDKKKESPLASVIATFKIKLAEAPRNKHGVEILSKILTSAAEIRDEIMNGEGEPLPEHKWWMDEAIKEFTTIMVTANWKVHTIINPDVKMLPLNQQIQDALKELKN